MSGVAPGVASRYASGVTDEEAWELIRKLRRMQKRAFNSRRRADELLRAYEFHQKKGSADGATR